MMTTKYTKEQREEEKGSERAARQLDGVRVQITEGRVRKNAERVGGEMLRMRGRKGRLACPFSIAS